MRDQQMKYLVLGVIALAGLGFVGWGMQTQWKFGGTTTATLPLTAIPVCGNGICETGEAILCTQDCPSGVTLPTLPQMTLPTLPQQQTLTCPSDADTKYEVNVVDSLDEDAYTRLAATVKKIDLATGQLIDQESSSASASTLMKVPCKNAQYKLIATDDDDSGNDIYDSEVTKDAFVIESGQMVGGRIPVTIPAKIQGTLSIEVWDNTGTRTDKNLSIATGGDSSDIRFEVKQTEDDKAAEGVMVLMNYSVTNTKKIEVEGLDAGLTASACDVPSIYAGEGGYEKAYCLFRNGQPLTLDGDSRSADPSSALYKMTYYTYSTTDPGAQNITMRAIDSLKVFKPDGASYEENGALLGEDINGNVGIAQTAEGTDCIYIE